MRRYAIGSVVLAIAATAGAAVYTAYASDREYVRLIAAGDQAVNADQPFQALEAYSGAIAIRPEAMLAHLKRGMVYRSRGELVEALKDLRRAADLDPTATRPAELLGDTQMALQRYEQATTRYQSYLTIDDRSARVWYKLGLAQYRAGQPSRSIASLDRALALEGGLAEVHLLKGLCLRDEGRLAAARLSLEAATRLAPGLVAPREALAEVYQSLGEQPRAIDQLEALAALDPTNHQRLVALGLAHGRARRFEAAVLALRGDSPLAFVFAGNGPQADRLTRFAASRPNAFHLPALPVGEYRELLGACGRFLEKRDARPRDGGVCEPRRSRCSAPRVSQPGWLTPGGEAPHEAAFCAPGDRWHRDLALRQLRGARVGTGWSPERCGARRSRAGHVRPGARDT